MGICMDSNTFYFACVVGNTRSSTISREKTKHKNFERHAATDITGFGLAGHVLEMIEDSDLTFHINIDEIPIFNEAFEMYERGVTTSVNKNNRNRVENNWSFSNKINPIIR